VTANRASLLWRAAERWPSRAAIADGDTQVDYAQLRDRAAGYADLLTGAGAVPGDRVALLFRRTWDAAAAVFGVWATGAVAVVLADVLRPRQIEHAVGHSRAVILLAGPDAARHHRSLELSAAVLAPPPDTVTSYDVVPRDGDDVAQLVYTSGSTGLAKGVMVSHANLRAGVEAVGRYLGIASTDRLASLLPFSFDYGLNQLLVSVASGASLVIERSPVPARIDRTLRSAGVTVAAGVPALWHQLLQAGSFRGEPIETLRIMTNTGGRLPEETVRQLRAGQPHAALFSMYGLTEAFRSTYLAPSLVDRKPTSVGRAIPGADVRVVRPDGSTCEPFEVGEIVHRGPTVTLGYWDDEPSTRQVFRCPAGHGDPRSSRNCAVHSGDFGWTDDDGDLYVKGRRDHMIKRLGYRVSPDEITDAVFASGMVHDACVTTAPGGGRDQDADVVGHVVLADGTEVGDLERHLAVELPRHLRPSQLVVHAALPTTPHGKHDLHALEGAAR
jgi:acyl-CoA synthetase (AMP-forming)/AMP-acid ligase II